MSKKLLFIADWSLVHQLNAANRLKKIEEWRKELQLLEKLKP